MSYFSRNLKKIRNVKNISQQQLADELGVKRSSIGAYEEGRAEPKIELLIKLAKKYLLTIDDLLTKTLTVNQITNFKTKPLKEKDYKIDNLYRVPVINSFELLDYINNKLVAKQVYFPEKIEFDILIRNIEFNQRVNYYACNTELENDCAVLAVKNNGELQKGVYLNDFVYYEKEKIELKEFLTVYKIQYHINKQYEDSQLLVKFLKG